MDRMEAVACGQTEEQCLAPAAAFALVGDETRVAILEALWEADTPAAFSAVYDAVDVETSAQFNYHLDRLTGPFVRKTDAGYELRSAGEHVVRATVAGSFNAHPTLDPFAVGDPCTACGADLLASYADEHLAVACPDCGRGHGEFPFPPGGLLDREGRDLLEAFDRRVRHRHGLARDGVCPECGGRTETAIRREAACCLDTDLQVAYTCQQCGHSLCSTVGMALLDRPSIVASYRDHGVDLAKRPYWQFGWCVSDEGTTVRSTDPWRIAVTVDPGDGDPGGEQLRVALDGALQIRETERY